MSADDPASAPPGASLVIYDRPTGEILSIHHFSAVQDVPLPPASELHELAVSHALLGTERDPESVGVLAVDSDDITREKVFRVSEEGALVEVTTELL